MMSRRAVAVAVLVLMGTLQLWDSRVFSAGVPVIALASIALLLPIGTLLFSERLDVRMGSVLVCALLLLTAKIIAPHQLPALGVTAVMAAAANWFAASKRLAG
jgi:hypothetical protein